MDTDNLNEKLQKGEPIVCELPRYGLFVGRDRELTRLEQFLLDQTSQSKAIMLVHGQRGVGKSSLVSRATNHIKERGYFKSIIWLDRTRAEEFLVLNENHNFPLPNSAIIDPADITQNNSQRFLNAFLSKKESGNPLPKDAANFLKELLTNQPFLLIIDDFDEDDSLAGNAALCEELARINLPNKVILTARSKQHRFQYRIFETLEIGLLNKDEVKELVSNSALSELDPIYWIDENLNATIDHIWEKTGGLAEIITRYLIPITEQKGWLLETGPEWLDSFINFAAGYIVTKSQIAFPSEYQGIYEKVRPKLITLFRDFSQTENQILFGLSLEEELQALEEKELARSLGYRPEERVEFSDFHNALMGLHENRLIGRICYKRHNQENTKPTSPISFTDKINNMLVWKWTLLPFEKELISELLTITETKQRYFQRQADRWISFTQGYIEAPQNIEPYVEKIYFVFEWCYQNNDWKRTTKLGSLLSHVLHAKVFHTKEIQQINRLIKICQKTADAAQQPEIDDWRIVVEQWILLARLYSETDNVTSEMQEFALKYATDAAQKLQAKQDEIPDAKWIQVAHIVAEICLQRGEVLQAQNWLEKVEQKKQQDLEWGVLAYLIAKLHFQRGNLTEAQHWWNKIIDSIDKHHNFEIATQAAIDAAHTQLSKNNLAQAVKFILHAEAFFDDCKNQSEKAEYIIKAETMKAQIAFRETRIDECKKSLNSAIDLAKNAKLYMISDELQRWLNFVMLFDNDFNPTDKIDSLLKTKLFWIAVEGQNICPICRLEFSLSNLLTNEMWCCSNCSAYFHTTCLTSNICPICEHVRAIEITN